MQALLHFRVPSCALGFTRLKEEDSQDRSLAKEALGRESTQLGLFFLWLVSSWNLLNVPIYKLMSAQRKGEKYPTQCKQTRQTHGQA